MRRGLAGLALLLAGARALAGDDEPTLEELLRQELVRPSAELAVSTASRMAQSLAAAPGVTHVVTRQDIERLGLRSLADILQLLPGVYLREDSLFTTLGVRGIGRPGDLNSRVLFLLDGMRLNENIFDAGQIDQDFLVDVGQIERVEFSPGPGSALYGNNAFLGVVQVITQRADPLRLAHLRGSFGARGAWHGSASTGQRLESGIEWWMGLSAIELRRIRLPAEVSPVLAGRLSDFNWDRGRRANGGLQWGGLSLRAGLVDRTRGFPEPLGDAVSDDLRLGQTLDRTRIQYGRLSWERNLGQRWALQAAWSSQQLRYQRDEPFLGSQGSERIFRFETLGRWDVAELRLAGPLAEDHELMVGYEGQRDRLQRLRFQVLGGGIDDTDRRSERWGLFAQDSWSLGPRQRLLLGLRFDHAGGSSRASPRVAYSWSDVQGRSLKLSLGNAFRAPNVSEAVNNEFQDLAAPPPERIRAAELSWDAPLAERWRYRVTAFSARLRNLIDQDLDSGIYQASAPVRSRGVEFELDGRWGNGASSQLSVANQSTHYAGGEALSNSPHWLLKARLSQPLPGGLRLSLHGRWVSERKVGDQRLPGYGLLNLQVLGSPHPQLDLFIGAFNALNRHYFDAPGSPGGPAVRHEGRQVQLGFHWRSAP